MKNLELFSGTGSFSNVAKERGHKVFTIDFDKSFRAIVPRELCLEIIKHIESNNESKTTN